MTVIYMPEPVSQVPTVVASVEYDPDAFPPDAHSIRASVGLDVDSLLRGTRAYIMTVEVEWGVVCSEDDLHVYRIDWQVKLPTLAECALYFGALCDRFVGLDNSTLEFETEVL